MKAIKKVRNQQQGVIKQKDPDNSEEEVEALYDADMDDLDSSDLGEEEKAYLTSVNSSKFDAGVESNMSTIKNALYVISSICSLLLLCSSIFAFITRRQLIFMDRTAPKYFFDLLKVIINFIFISMWV